MATQTPPAAYRSTKASTDRRPGAYNLAPQNASTKPGNRRSVRPRAAHSIHERGRHVWDSKIDASTRRRMARAPTAVGGGRTIADSRRALGRHRPLRRAKAEG